MPRHQLSVALWGWLVGAVHCCNAYVDGLAQEGRSCLQGLFTVATLMLMGVLRQAGWACLQGLVTVAALFAMGLCSGSMAQCRIMTLHC